MIKKALKEITSISDDDEINTENYLEALTYLDNIYKVVTVIEEYFSIDDLHFLPSFKGKYVVEKIGMLSTTEENELRVFKLQSPLFLETEKLQKLENSCVSEIGSDVTFEDDVLTIVLK